MNVSSIKRRWVLYISGFDPAGPAKYHQIYQGQSQLAAQQLNANIEVGKRQNLAAGKTAQWKVIYAPMQAQSAPLAHSESLETDYVFGRWDDVVRQHWLGLRSAKDVWVFLCAFLSTHFLYWRAGAMPAMFRLSPPPTLALIVPFLGVAVGIALMLSLLFSITAFVLENFLAVTTWPLRFQPSGLMAGILFFVNLLWWLALWQLEKRWHSLWLSRSLILTHLQVQGKTPELDARIDLFAQHIRSAAASGLYDEILVVGHSSGSMLATLALARAWPLSKPPSCQIGLLTLGHCWPLLTCMPLARSIQTELIGFAHRAEVRWVDVSAPSDGCCFALLDPLSTLPNHQQNTQAWVNRPQLVSARWHTLFSAEDYRALKQDRFRLHFQYIYATPSLGACDFFAITAGDQTLAKRFANL
jgi:hypothetical protein